MKNGKIISVAYQNRLFNAPIFPTISLFNHLFHPVEGHIHQQGGNDPALRRSTQRVRVGPVFHDARFEPCPDGLSHGRVGLEFVQESLMPDMIEAASDVRIVDKFWFVSDCVKDGSYGIMA